MRAAYYALVIALCLSAQAASAAILTGSSLPIASATAGSRLSFGLDENWRFAWNSEGLRYTSWLERHSHEVLGREPRDSVDGSGQDKIAHLAAWQELCSAELASREAPGDSIKKYIMPEPATLSLWGVSALALAAAAYRRQKRGFRTKEHVRQAVEEYLEASASENSPFALLGSYLTRFAGNPEWSSQDIQAFYDEVVLSLHSRQRQYEVA